MKLTFLGATGTVTGSKYLLEDGDEKILVDCGLFQGLKELRLRNWDALSVDVASIDAVILTHAHLDHSGYIPRLCKAGFKGDIYCSEATYDLCRILLPDSGRIQEEDAESANRHGYSKHKPALPLYSEAEAYNALEYFKPLPFGREHAVGDFLKFRLHRAGHILGASFVHICDGKTSILFSGDIGRLHDPIMQPPAQIQQADYLVLESTYGDRLHGEEDPAQTLADVICSTIARGGTVVIPSFAVGRAQAVMYYLHRLKFEKRIPEDMPIYIDIPMAINASNLLSKHMQDHRMPSGLCRHVCDVVEYVHTPEESKFLDRTDASPAIIISASGMATGGRVLHHLKRFLGDARNTILFAGYQAAGTRGDRLIRGESEIKIHGRMWPVRAQVVQLDNMSAHADYSEILQWLGYFNEPPRKTYMTHGEPHAAESLRSKIAEKYNWDVIVPEYLQTEIL